MAVELGKKLYFQPPAGLTARQISASELLMNLGLLAAAESMLSASEQLSNRAAALDISDGNSSNVASQLKNSHVPTFKNNISGAFEQYIHHLTYEEAKPYMSLLDDSKLNEFKSMSNNDSKTINNNITVSGPVSGPIQIQAGESITHTQNENVITPLKPKVLSWLISNIGKVLFSLISAALIAWFGLK